MATVVALKVREGDSVTRGQEIVELACGLLSSYVAFHFGFGWQAAGMLLLTWGLLAPFYYLCFFPMHLALKIRGKDPLHRQVPTAEPTYWTPRKPVADLTQYRKQF